MDAHGEIRWMSEQCRRLQLSLRPARWSVDLATGTPIADIGPMTTDPHAVLRDRAFASVFDGPGESDAVLRQAAAEGKNVPPELAALVDKIHRHAYKVTDDDLTRLRATYSEDQLFEIVVSAALGASRERLVAGLAALEKA
jgi:hypothetical protein